MSARKLTAATLFSILILVSAGHATCTNASLKGTFGLLDRAAGTSGVGTEIGQIVFDGIENVTTNTIFVITGSSGWNLDTNMQSGTYSVSSNCVGTVSIINPDGSNAGHFRFIIQSGKEAAQFIQLDAGTSSFEQTGFVVTQGNATCGLTGIQRTFAANLWGAVVGTGPVGYVGQVDLDGKGSISGSMTMNLNGAVSAASITGKYTESANCTGTATISSAAFGTLNLNFVVVSSGNQLLLIEIDGNTVVSGTLQPGQQQ